MANKCSPIQYGDTTECQNCGAQWDTDYDEPMCPCGLPDGAGGRRIQFALIVLIIVSVIGIVVNFAELVFHTAELIKGAP